jgi:predicted O-methyltransferase YrrM
LQFRCKVRPAAGLRRSERQRKTGDSDLQRKDALMILKRDEIRTLAGMALGFPGLTAIGWWFWGPVSLIPALTVLFIVLAGVVLAGIRRLRGDLEESLRQTQALLFLNTHLHTQQALPALGGAALLPDSAALLVGLINQHRPRRILELGSGVSTLVCAHALRQLGEGRIISLDHDPHYAEITRNNLRRHSLEDWAQVRTAPIEPVSIAGRDWQWYAVSQLSDDELIDLVIVDGPPKKIQNLARYPAVPLLLDRLAPDCQILLDDTNRRQEAEIVRRWQVLLEGFEMEQIPMGKGATIFRRKSAFVDAGTSDWPPLKAAS